MNLMELKNCPNCKMRISVNDIKCPYCEYIDDKRYKKENEKLKVRKMNENKYNRKYKKKFHVSKKRRKRNQLLLYVISSLIIIICIVIYVSLRVLK